MRVCFGSIEIVPYRPDIECEDAYALWERNFGRRWPITLGIFREITEAVHSRVETYQLAARDHTGRLIDSSRQFVVCPLIPLIRPLFEKWGQAIIPNDIQDTLVPMICFIGR